MTTSMRIMLTLCANKSDLKVGRGDPNKKIVRMLTIKVGGSVISIEKYFINSPLRSKSIKLKLLQKMERQERK